ncbi:TRI47 protein, partial [Polyodon spathula]|nr:TRI47 protein [Polyodon spathula]
MASNLWSEDHFSCPVCLEILKDPVTTACGHSYCMGCIKNCWDQTDHISVYRCPQCRETFTPRPVLRRNTMLTEVVEELKKTGLNPPPAQSCAGSGDLPCDACTGRKFKAVKSCLMCLASYCETHVKSHYEGAAFKRHKLVNAIGNLEQYLCAEHQRLCEVFCRTDQTCICLLCSQTEHKSHDTVSAEAERTGKQKQLGETQTEIQQRIQERLKEVEELKQAVESIKRSACIEIKESEKIFTELIQSIEKIHTEVIELIGAKEKAVVNQAEGRMKKLEQEIAELSRRNVDLKQLSETEDHIHFLQNFQSICVTPEAGDLPSITVNTDISFGAVRKAVSKLKDNIEDFCKGEIVQVTTTDSCPGCTETYFPSGRLTSPVWTTRQQTSCPEELQTAWNGACIPMVKQIWERFQPTRVDLFVTAESISLPPMIPHVERHGIPGNTRTMSTLATGALVCVPSTTITTSDTREDQGGESTGFAGCTQMAEMPLFLNEVAVYRLQAPEPRNRAEFLKLNEVAVYSLQAPEPRNRAEFLKYSCQLTLDPNTAYRELCLSERNRTVTLSGETEPCSDHPERFDYYPQVLCRDGLSGTCCYWEIDCGGGGAYIGVTYKGICRKGGDRFCGLGYNDKSWSLLCSGSSYTALHNNNQTAITAPHSPRIGVYLDFNVGTLSFYGISDTMILLHRFQTTFTEPLYPGFGLDCYGSFVTICQLN